MLREMTQSTPETSAVLFEIEKNFGGHLPNIFKAYAKYPPLLEANWNKYKAIMLQGRLSRKVKECIATLISKDNNCEYCITAHSDALRSLGITEPQIDALLHGILPNDFSDKEVALIKFACKSNLSWHHMDNNDRRKLSEMEINEAEMLEALGTMELFIAFNRFVDVMGTEIDF